MNDFSPFAAAVNARLRSLGSAPLFVVEVPDLFEKYLAAFPEGTNPVYRERTEHDCSTCKQFVRNLGRVVAIVDGRRQSVWSGLEGVQAPYDTVAAAMAEIVENAPITGAYRTKEPSYGAQQSHEQTDGGVHTWTHFYGAVPKSSITKTPEADAGTVNTVAGVLRRGLVELQAGDIETVVDLINSNSLYRGEEHMPALAAFQQLRQGYTTAEDKDAFVWGNVHNPAARFRNTVIGTLLVDLAEGKDLEAAVKAFETKVAPQNYKRSSALITPRMVAGAVEKLRELGLESAIERRYARLSDVSVNDVLFVDNAARAQMRDSLTTLLLTAVPKKPVDLKDATPISVDDFVRDVLPRATSLDVLVKNDHLTNFVSLTAPQHADAARLFQWDNGFGWSYDGEVTDSLRDRVAAAGGRVDGVLRFSHQWNDVGRNASLMDLHVFLPGSSPHRTGSHDNYPSGPRVGWNQRSDAGSGGTQDVDYVHAAPPGYVPVENITFPDLAKLRDGVYTFKIHNWQLRKPTTSGFKAEIAFGGQSFTYEHPAPLGHKEWITLAKVTLKNGAFTIDHEHPTSTSSRNKWGVDTETLVPVETLMNSPNHWEGAGAVGNRHWMFILRGCQNPGETRGIYNEFLRTDLHQHRKVFEVLGAKTRCPVAAEQLSGVGFSSARGDKATVVARGPDFNRAFEIRF